MCLCTSGDTLSARLRFREKDWRGHSASGKTEKAPLGDKG